MPFSNVIYSIQRPTLSFGEDMTTMIPKKSNKITILNIKILQLPTIKIYN